MKFKAPSPSSAPVLAVACASAGFTLAEVLAALLFMAIVIPVALEGMHIASRAGSVAVRKSEAARVADRILNEYTVSTNWNSGGAQSGSEYEGFRQYTWSLQNDAWSIDRNFSTLRQLAVDVKFAVQGQSYSVRLSTLVDSAPPTNSIQ